MNALPLYVSLTRLVLEPCQNLSKIDLLELNSKIPELRQQLSCIVCCQLVMDPFKPTSGRCQHNVCRLCIRGKKQLYPKCANCINRDSFKTYRENKQLASLVSCYKSLCLTMQSMGLYDRLAGYRPHQPTQYGQTPSIPLPNMTVQEFIDEGAIYDDVWNKFNEDLPHPIVERVSSRHFPSQMDTPPTTEESFSTDHSSMDKRIDLMETNYVHENDATEFAMDYAITPEHHQEYSPATVSIPYTITEEGTLSEASTSTHTLIPIGNMPNGGTILEITNESFFDQNQDQNMQTNWVNVVDLSAALQISNIHDLTTCSETCTDITTIGSIIDTRSPTVLSIPSETRYIESCIDDTANQNIIETTSPKFMSSIPSVVNTSEEPYTVRSMIDTTPSTSISLPGVSTNAESFTDMTRIGNIIHAAYPTDISLPGVATSAESCTDDANMGHSIETASPTVISIPGRTTSVESCPVNTAIGNIIDTASPTVISIPGRTISVESCPVNTAIGNIIDTASPTVISMPDVTNNAESCTEITTIENFIDTASPTVISIPGGTTSVESCTVNTNIGNIIDTASPSVISMPSITTNIESYTDDTTIGNTIDTSSSTVISMPDGTTNIDSYTDDTTIGNIIHTSPPTVISMPDGTTIVDSYTNDDTTIGNITDTTCSAVPGASTNADSYTDDTTIENITDGSLPGVATNDDSCTDDTIVGNITDTASIPSETTNAEPCATVLGTTSPTVMPRPSVTTDIDSYTDDTTIRNIIDTSSPTVVAMTGVTTNGESCTDDTSNGNRIDTASPTVISMPSVSNSVESCKDITHMKDTMSPTVITHSQMDFSTTEVTEKPIHDSKPRTRSRVTTTTKSSRTEEESDVELTSPPAKRKRKSYSSLVNGCDNDDNVATSSNVDSPQNNMDIHTPSTVSGSISPSTSTETTTTNPDKPVFCRCGTSTAKKLKHFTCFRRRCPCYKSNLPCTDLCKCAGCCNPRTTINGTNVTSTTISTRANSDDTQDIDNEIQQAIPTVSSTTNNNNSDNINNILPQIQKNIKAGPEQPLIVIENPDGTCQLVKLFDSTGQPILYPLKLGYLPVEVATSGITITAYYMPPPADEPLSLQPTSTSSKTVSTAPSVCSSGIGSNDDNTHSDNHIDETTTSTIITKNSNASPHPSLDEDEQAPSVKKRSNLEIISMETILTPNSNSSHPHNDDSCSPFSDDRHDALSNDLSWSQEIPQNSITISNANQFQWNLYDMILNLSCNITHTQLNFHNSIHHNNIQKQNQNKDFLHSIDFGSSRTFF